MKSIIEIIFGKFSVSYSDAMTYYVLIGKLRSRNIVEIRSGLSSLGAFEASLKMGTEYSHALRQRYFIH